MKSPTKQSDTTVVFINEEQSRFIHIATLEARLTDNAIQPQTFCFTTPKRHIAGPLV